MAQLRLCILPVLALTLLSGFSSGPASEVIRYRGEYTYGHEVRAFCPAINSQCYWVGADTTKAVHATLKALAMVPGSAPYTPVCVIMEGRIDRETQRTGFAADYDGVISVARVFGRCDDTDIVTHGDLQHHRWLLQSIDNKALDRGTPDNMIPQLDFGERMTVTGNTGCNRFSGQAVLREEFFIIEPMASTRRLCEPARNETERMMLRVLGRESAVSIDAEGRLILEADQVVLRFHLSDWK